MYAMYAGRRGLEASVPLENKSGQGTFLKLNKKNGFSLSKSIVSIYRMLNLNYICDLFSGLH